MTLCLASGAQAESLRLAVFHVDLERRGPGLLLRDILSGDDEQVLAVTEVITEIAPDVLVLLGFDYDAGGVALGAFADHLGSDGLAYPTRFALRPNAGLQSGVDVDGDGRTPEPQDAHGFGRFSGEGGMALLARVPVDVDGVRDFSGLLWRDLPGNRAAQVVTPEVADVLRLSTMGIWDVPLMTEAGPFHVLAIHAGPPVFDGPEDRNGWRNHDETRFLVEYLDGWAPDGAPFDAGAFAILGTLNVDPARGEGQRAALRTLLDHPRLQDVRPERPGGGVETVDWPEPTPGDLRVDYVLPGAALAVTGSGVFWPDGGDAASSHRIVWVDVVLP